MQTLNKQSREISIIKILGNKNVSNMKFAWIQIKPNSWVPEIREGYFK